MESLGSRSPGLGLLRSALTLRGVQLDRGLTGLTSLHVWLAPRGGRTGVSEAVGVQASGERLAQACDIWGPSPLRPGTPRRGGLEAACGFQDRDAHDPLSEVAVVVFTSSPQSAPPRSPGPPGVPGRGTVAPPDQTEDWLWVLCRWCEGPVGLWGAEPPHLSLLHRWAPLVMVKPPVSSCCTCMARRRAEGSVGCARKRLPSIRHRLSLFRKTWEPSQGRGRGETGERSVWGAQLRQPRLALGSPLQGGYTALMCIPSTLYLGRGGRKSGCLKLADTRERGRPSDFLPPEMANLFPNLLSLGSRK